MDEYTTPHTVFLGDDNNGWIDEGAGDDECAGTGGSLGGEIVDDGGNVYANAPAGENSGGGNAPAGATAVIQRDERGRWLPGGAPKPPPWNKGKRVGSAAALEQALERALPADQVEYYLTKALDMAVEWKSYKGILEVIKLRLAYGLGMPVQRSITASTKLESILAQVGEMSDEEFDVVEAELRGE